MFFNYTAFELSQTSRINATNTSWITINSAEDTNVNQNITYCLNLFALNITAMDLKATRNYSLFSLHTNVANNGTSIETDLRANLAGNKTEIATTITANATKTELNLRANLAGNRTEINAAITQNITLAQQDYNTNISRVNNSLWTKFMNVTGGKFSGAITTQGNIQLNDKINMTGSNVTQTNCIHFTNGASICIGSN